MAAIKIITVPPGEAPQHIREAWVGLVLPLAVPGARSGLLSAGVLSGPKTEFSLALYRLFRKIRRMILGRSQGNAGYVVNAEAAVAILELAHPAVADWWKQNTPHILVPGHNIIFSAACCTEAENIVWPPPPRSEQ